VLVLDTFREFRLGTPCIMTGPAEKQLKTQESYTRTSSR